MEDTLLMVCQLYELLTFTSQAYWARKGVICAFWGEVEDQHSGIASTTIELLSWEVSLRFCNILAKST